MVQRDRLKSLADGESLVHQGCFEVDRLSGHLKGLQTRQSASDEAAARPKDWSTWRDATLKARKDGRPFQACDAKLCYRIAFTLCRSNLLWEQIDVLDARVKDLSRVTASAFTVWAAKKAANAPCIRTKLLDAEGDLMMARDFEIFTNDELYQAYRDLQHECPWALELRVPGEPDNKLNIERRYHLDLDFSLCLDGDAQGGLWRRVRVNHDSPVNAKAVARGLPRRILMLKPSSRAVQTADILLLNDMYRRSKPFRALLQGGRLMLIETAKA